MPRATRRHACFTADADSGLSLSSEGCSAATVSPCGCSELEHFNPRHACFSRCRRRALAVRTPYELVHSPASSRLVKACHALHTRNAYACRTHLACAPSHATGIPCRLLQPRPGPERRPRLFERKARRFEMVKVKANEFYRPGLLAGTWTTFSGTNDREPGPVNPMDSAIFPVGAVLVCAYRSCTFTACPLNHIVPRVE